MQLEVDDLADVIAKSIQTATDPLLSRVATLSNEVVALAAEIVVLKAREVIHGRNGDDGAPGPPGPAGAPGTNGTDGAEGRPGLSVEPAQVKALVDTAVSTLPPAKDGIGLVGVLIDRDGHLIVTLSDGGTKDVGLVVGRDVDMGEVSRRLAEAVAKFPVPKNGVDGKDGLGFDDMEPVFDEFGRPTLRFVRGEVVKDVRIPCIVDRGVWKSGTAYEAGDGATWSGSFWIAQEPTSAKPGEAGVESRAWRLAVKKGADGKGEKGEPGANGKDGRPGRDGRYS